MAKVNDKKLTFNYDPDTKTGFLTYASGTKTFLEGPIASIVKELWKMMCQVDGVPHDSQFVVFSDDNPIAPLYRTAMAAYWSSRA